MDFLTPTIGLLAAAVVAPILALLYFLKLKRTEQVVSTTLLWKRAVQDLQVNAPFQRIRRNILLLLQALALALILLALAGPILAWRPHSGRRYVLLIDRSASMNTLDTDASGGTRLTSAKDQAKAFLETLVADSLFALKRRADQVMVVAFDNHPKVMCTFTSDKAGLRAAIDQVTPTDKGSLLSEAVTVARAFAQSPGEENNNRTAEQPANLVLFSDGRIADLGQIAVGKDEMVFERVGTEGANVAVTAMQAKRSYEDPDLVYVFATIAQYGDQAVTLDVQVSIDANVVAVRQMTIPAAKTGQDPNTFEPGKAGLDLSLRYAGDGVLEVRHLHKDALAGDDAAWAVLNPPKRLQVLLVTQGNQVLASVLGACPMASLDTLTPAEFDRTDPGQMAVAKAYDVIVLDDCQPKQRPKAGYLVLGRPPDGIDVTSGEVLENQFLIDWRSQHAILRYVNLANVFVAKAVRLGLPRDAQVLAEFTDGPAMGVVRRNGSTFLVVGFDVMQSNWPFEPGFVLFCVNSLEFLGLQAAEGRARELKAGDPLLVDDVPLDAKAVVRGPGIEDTAVKADPAGLIRWASTDRAGVYRVTVEGRPANAFAVNVLDQAESDIRPQAQLVLSGQAVQAQSRTAIRANVPLWPALVVLALVMVCVEWAVYTSKVRI